MSNHLAIANVTAVLKYMVYCSVVPSMSDIDINVTSIQPSKDPNFGKGKDSGGVNIYLYQSLLNPSRRNEDLAMRNEQGQLVKKPLVPLDLYYLLSFYGDEEKLVPQRLLGSTLQTLHTTAFLSREIIRQTNQQAPNHYLAESGLIQQEETIKLVPLSMSLEDLTKIWSVFFQLPYNISVAYKASVVLLEGQEIEPIKLVETYGVNVKDYVQGDT